MLVLWMFEVVFTEEDMKISKTEVEKVPKLHFEVELLGVTLEILRR